MKPLASRAAALAALCFVALAAARSEQDGLPIIERAFEAAKVNAELVRNYVFHERFEQRRFDRHGNEKRRHSQTWDVTLFEGSDYRRLIAQDDRPLDPAAEAKEQKRLERHIRKLQNEKPRQRARRLAKVEKERREGEEFLREITRAFEFRVIGEEEVGGIATWAISAEPKPGYEPPNRVARVLTRVRATLWVARQSHGWVRADIETFDDISWMGIYKLREGTRIRFSQRYLNDEVWVTDRFNVRFRARIGFVYSVSAELTGTYSNFRRFSTDTTVTEWSVAD